MSMADQNSYMNAIDISDEEELLDEMDEEQSIGGQVEAFIARNPVAAVAGAFLVGVLVGGACFAVAQASTHRSVRSWL